MASITAKSLPVCPGVKFNFGIVLWKPYKQNNVLIVFGIC